MIKILHLSDIHLGSGFSHGQINPETGLNTRLEDFTATLGRCIDRAIAEPVDLVLFGGDAFPDATPAPYVKQAFAAQFRRLVDAEIPTVLLVGNHDQHSQGQGGASLGIYRTLGVPGFVVGDSLATHTIQTRNGAIQIITLPWLTRSTLLTRPETEGLSLEAVNQLLIDRLTVVLEGEIRQLDPKLPTILLGHLMADKANLGAERFLAVGKGFNIPLSLLTRSCFEYVALGHVHKHQNLNRTNDPPVIYPGSIERVDFSEEKEDKGFILIEVEKGQVKWQFCPLTVRSFCTIKVDLSKSDDPLQTLIKVIEKNHIQDAVVRLIYQLRSDQLDLINNTELYQLLSAAHSYTIKPELVSQLARPRLPELDSGSSIDPLDALKTYLTSREDLLGFQTEMIEAAQLLLAGE
ncbi:MULTISPECIES: exonuclease subunit SbcD [Planktothrix]|jgi:exonuclease SbcD|uniref:Nuclease SbcCD subunit D n=1 Tax=Planktothrix rubescens CCAP 1459/22 TaxID=329571 RepID=A0A6J7ZHN4_PLARU|nr:MULTISPECIES: exonuclease subunit SbcD [Planktothrix]CAD5932755.1 Nuclease SbcCD subunit D [Planktothrix rubescens]CAC5341111.1 putative exonuclease, SbcD-like [Planktothrix rubescens NIVA-CYA 18]CAD0231125.1 Nuclease SbcCD subunit D [Planktothrix agardhii]CAD5934144.1 Nuclease SbcCD subunit D [Planktothrix rubescens NIVA-CYA 18]CAD5936135.1 Nuclease SbcCD subunit D [Planktothrix agardhii]